MSPPSLWWFDLVLGTILAVDGISGFAKLDDGRRNKPTSSGFWLQHMNCGSKRPLALTVTIATALFLSVVSVQERASAATTDPFFGVMSQSAISASDFEKMGWARIGAYRLPVAWDTVAAAGEDKLDWAEVDRVTSETSRRGIRLLPVLYRTPLWLSTRSRQMPVWNRYAISKWKEFLAQAVDRYGPEGEFWEENPDLEPMPIRQWQIWNEANIRNFARPVSPRAYAKLVKVSARKIRRLDRGAKIVLGGFYAKPPSRIGIPAARFLRRMYQVRGLRASFDTGAIHPYASSTRRALGRTFSLRREMNRNRDRRKPILVTEFGWGSDSETVFGTGDPYAQGDQLHSAVSAFLKHRNRLRLHAIYWFSWNDLLPGVTSCSFCSETGLFDAWGQAKPAWYRLLDFTHSI